MLEIHRYVLVCLNAERQKTTTLIDRNGKLMKNILTITVCALLAVFTIGCGTFKRQPQAGKKLTIGTYDHGIKGNVVYTGKETNKVEVDLRTQGFGPAPQLQIPAPPAGSSSQPQQNIGPYSNPPFPQYQPPQSQLDLKRGMNAYRADPSSPIGASQLLPKPVANSEMSVAVQWSGINGAPPTYYFHNASKGSDTSETFFAGQLVAGSTRTWDNTATDIQLPVRGGYQQCNDGFLPAGTLVFYGQGGSYNPGGFVGQSHNYYGGGGYSQGRGYVSYNPTQLPAPRGNSSNHYWTGNSNYH